MDTEEEARTVTPWFPALEDSLRRADHQTQPPPRAQGPSGREPRASSITSSQRSPAAFPGEDVSEDESGSRSASPEPGAGSASTGGSFWERKPSGNGREQQPAAGGRGGASPVSRGPRSLPPSASWPCPGATAASACGLGTARQPARSATGAESCLQSPGLRPLAPRRCHLGENESSSDRTSRQQHPQPSNPPARARGGADA